MAANKHPMNRKLEPHLRDVIKDILLPSLIPAVVAKLNGEIDDVSEAAHLVRDVLRAKLSPSIWPEIEFMEDIVKTCKEKVNDSVRHLPSRQQSKSVGSLVEESFTKHEELLFYLGLQVPKPYLSPKQRRRLARAPASCLDIASRNSVSDDATPLSVTRKRDSLSNIMARLWSNLSPSPVAPNRKRATRKNSTKPQQTEGKRKYTKRVPSENKPKPICNKSPPLTVKKNVNIMEMTQDERYHIHTITGEVVDARSLSRTRCGRLVKPVLDVLWDNPTVDELNNGSMLL